MTGTLRWEVVAFQGEDDTGYYRTRKQALTEAATLVKALGVGCWVYVRDRWAMPTQPPTYAASWSWPPGAAAATHYRNGKLVTD